MKSTDYLVVGAGTSGLAFADTLVAESDVDIVIVDRRPSPGGHWADVYPFVRLHSPSAYYGVNSLRLGNDQIDADGPNAGLYERATAAEIQEYFKTVVDQLEATGRVRVLLGHEHVGTDGGTEVVRELATGRTHEIPVRHRVVDARFLEASIPATHTPSFAVADDASFVPVHRLPDAARSSTAFTVLGAGKTAVDACLWLLENDVDADRIRWVRPRDAWFHDRERFQPDDLVVDALEGFATDARVGATASDLTQMVEGLDEAGRIVRIDPDAPASMYRGGMLSAYEIDRVRQVEDVVRLGRVRRIERERLVLEEGELPTGGSLHIDATAAGLRLVPPEPIFSPRRMTLQQVRHKTPPFNAALLGFVEAHRDDDEVKNRLCPPNPFTSDVKEWARTVARTWRTEGGWRGDPDLQAWVASSRLNLMRALPRHLEEPRALSALGAYAAHVSDAIVNLERLAATDDPAA